VARARVRGAAARGAMPAFRTQFNGYGVRVVARAAQPHPQRARRMAS
jgi:hypothetical protein